MAPDSAAGSADRSLPRGAWRALAHEEAACWGHALRVALAAALALWIALRLDLASPSSAALTVMLVSLPRAGQSLEKSLYRLLGTLAGAVAGLLLVAAFTPQRDLFVLALATWLAACVAGSAWYRHSQAYAWMLAGYTACVVGFPGFQDPAQAFDVAVDRLTVVSIGVICGGLVSAVAFPGASRDVLVATVRAAFRDFAGLVSRCFTGAGRRAELDVVDQHFARDVMRLEATRVWSAFEDPGLAGTRRLDGFISSFMLASTTARAVEHLRADLGARGLREVRAALAPVADLLLAALRGPGEVLPASAADAAPIADDLTTLASRWGTHAAAARARLGPLASPGDRIELDSALALLRQFLRDARELARSYAELQAPPGALDQLPARPLRRRPDPPSAGAAGLRAAVTFLAVCAFWIVSGWEEGMYAATATAVGCSIFASSPTPVRAAGRELLGYCLGFVAAFVSAAFVLPAMQGFPLLVAGLAPFLLLGGYLTARPSTAPVGWPYGALLFISLRITDDMHYDVGSVMNVTIANMVGIAAAAASFAVVLPPESRLRAALLERALTRQLRVALTGRRVHLRHRFEAVVRDLTLQLADLPGADAAERRRRVLHGIRVLEAGHAVLALRAHRERPALRAWVPELDAALARATAALASRRPDDARGALGALDALRAGVDADAAAAAVPPAPLIALRTSVWLLHLAVEEHAAALAARATGARLAPEVSHAA